jgi:hypothetical protein
LELILNGGPEPDPKTGALRLLRAPLEALLVPLGLTVKNLDTKAGPDTSILNDTMIRNIVSIKGVPVVQINLQVDPPTVEARRPPRSEFNSVPVFIITADGPALLIKDPASPELLKRDDMPKGLLEYVNNAKRLLGTKKSETDA